MSGFLFTFYLKKIAKSNLDAVANRFGNWDNTTGMGGGQTHHDNQEYWAYRDNVPFSPYDYFYFGDFFFRIHRNDNPALPNTPTMIANCPEDARYNDGRYDIYAEVTDVRDSTFQSDTLEFILDNFKPYVQTIELFFNEREVYSNGWICGNGNVALSCDNAFDVGLPSYPNDDDEFMLVATASEPMNALTMNLIYNNQTNGAYLLEVSEDSTQWIFTFLVADYSSGITTFSFEGTDMNDNQLLNLANYADIGFDIPIRQANNNWTNSNITQGIDSTFSFDVNCGTGFIKNGNGCVQYIAVPEPELSCNQLTAQITHATDTNPGSIDLDVTGGIGILEYQWSNGATTQNIQNLNPGGYRVIITDQLCCQEEFFFEVKDLCADVNIAIDSPQITTPTSCNSTDGQIKFFTTPASGGTSPYTLTWSNTNTGYWTNANLSPGIYYLTVTDANGCTATTSYDLSSDGTPQVVTLPTPGCSGMSDGSIWVFGYTEDGIGEMSYQWSTGNTSDEITGLDAGIYTVTVTNTDNGCSTTASVVLEEYEAESPLAISAEVTSTSCLQPTGSIDLTVTGGVFPYSFWWETAEGFYASIDDLENLPENKYCVKVTDYCGTVVKNCYVVKSCKSDVEIVLNSIYHCTSYIHYEYADDDETLIEEIRYNDDGAIHIGVLGALGSYQILWSNGSTEASIANLSSGTYSVSVVDETGCCTTASYKIEGCPVGNTAEFNAKIRGGLITGNEDQITLEALIGHQGTAFTADIPDDYIVNWQVGDEYISGHPHTITLDISDLDVSELPKVILSINNGCAFKSVSKYLINCEDEYSDDVLSNFFITPIYIPCEDFADGIIDINLPVADTEDLLVTFNGSDYSGVLDGEDNSISIGGLKSGTYPVEISIGGCEFSFSFTLSTQPTVKAYVSNDGDYCEYAEYCNGDPIGTYLMEIYEGGFYPEVTSPIRCRVPYYCGDRLVKTRHKKRLKMRGLELFHFLSELATFDDDLAQQASIELTRLNFNGGEDQSCDVFSVCPTSLQINHIANGSVQGQETDSNGCTHVDCRSHWPVFPIAGLPFFNNWYEAGLDVDYCPSVTPQIVESIYPFVEIYEGNPCDPQGNTVAILQYQLENGYFDNIPAFQNNHGANSLYSRLTSEDSDCNLCDKIYYCKSTYEVIAIKEISCDLGNGNESHVQDLGNGTFAINCITDYECVTQDCDLNILTIYFGANYPFDGLAVDNTPDDCTFEVIKGDMEIEELVNLVEITLVDGYVFLDGIVKTPSKTLYYDFSGGGGEIRKYPMENVKFMLDNLEKDEVIYIEEVMENKQYDLVFSDTLSDWKMAIEGSDQLTIDHLSKEDTYIEIGGTITGDLQYNGSLLLQPTSTSAFDIKIGLDGQILSQKTIENIDPDEKVIFSKNDNQEMLIIGRYAGESLEIDGTTVGFDESNGGFMGSINSTNNVNVLNALSGSESMQILNAKYQKTGGITTIFKTNDAIPIKLDDNLIVAQQENEIVVLSLNPDGTFKWSQSFNADKIDQEKMAITYDEDDNLLLGLTFTEGFYFQGEQFISEGGNDILLLKLANETGDLEWFETYGSVDDENVSQLFYFEKELVFGGEMSFSQMTRGELRNIGVSCFYNTTNSTQKAYITHTILPKKSKDPKPKLLAGNNQNNTGVSWNVYPNPFNNAINVRVTSEKEERATLELYDIYGRSVLTFQEELSSGENTFSFEIGKQLAAGVYFLKIQKNSGNAVWKLSHF